MNSTEIVHLRLYNQLVRHHPCIKPEEVVHWMGALQAQDYNASLLAIGLRLPKSEIVNQQTIEQSIFDRKIVRTWPMRGTLHFVSAADVYWMLNLLTSRVIRSNTGRYRQLDLNEAEFNKSRKIMEKVLEGGNQMARNQLFGALEAAGISTSGQRGIHILSHLAQMSVICLGPFLNKQPTFVLLEEWIPHGKILEKDYALAELAHRYIKSHGPATVYDFATWAGLLVSEAREGISLNRGLFQQVNVDGQVFWFSEPNSELRLSENSEEIYLLPAFDEMLCGYKDKTAVLSLDNIKSTILRNGIIRPLILVNNRAVGTWKWGKNKEKVILDTLFSKRLNKEQNNAIEAKAKKLESFFISKN